MKPTFKEIDDCDICTKRFDYELTDEDGHEHYCGSLTAIINPFPRKGEPHCQSIRILLKGPTLTSVEEVRVYKALVEAIETRAAMLDDRKGQDNDVQ